MDYFLMVLLGLLGGGAGVFVALARQRRSLAEAKKQRESQHKEISEILEDIRLREQKLHEFEIRVVTYNELQEENAILKRDLRNAAVHLRKLELDHQSQETNDQRISEPGS
jgi:multidrug resistance efflux pump